jgi:hypothetical protein
MHRCSAWSRSFLRAPGGACEGSTWTRPALRSSYRSTENGGRKEDQPYRSLHTFRGTAGIGGLRRTDSECLEKARGPGESARGGWCIAVRVGPGAAPRGWGPQARGWRMAGCRVCGCRRWPPCEHWADEGRIGRFPMSLCRARWGWWGSFVPCGWSRPPRWRACRCWPRAPRRAARTPGGRGVRRPRSTAGSPRCRARRWAAAAPAGITPTAAVPPTRSWSVRWAVPGRRRRGSAACRGRRGVRLA